jgi:hypothetical protein
MRLVVVKHVTIQSRTQSIPVRRLGAGHDSGETEYRISNFGYPVSCAHAQTATQKFFWGSLSLGAW